ncbi:MAG: Fe-S cluster assembly protein HesB [Candidatus Lokiarchaeota archaeon]|nr:Fe-S cluster assembly protein HesB [Candidatus Lokiarchaeota archaeon]
MNQLKIKAFQEKIFAWWERHKRSFPWRKTNNPYKILVSEFMLQQTQTTRVKEIYRAFLRIFPTIESLAKSKPSEVLRFWSQNRLGYNRRALWLHEAANQIVKNENFPKTIKELRDLKGIGPYASRSILIFAFNSNIATVDTNIRRILIAEGFAREETSDKDLLEIATQLLPKDRSRDWHNALMDYGAIKLTSIKTGIKPRSKQSKFKGSNRQFRGKVVEYLTKINVAEKEKIIRACKIPKDKIEQVLNSLIKDGLVIKEQNEDMYQIKK